MAELKRLGRYELRHVLGKGAMGVVYEGYDPMLSRRVAVKTILKSAAFDEETERAYAERFAREAKAVARLNHPNIVQVFDYGVENEAAYLVMEFIEGRELRGYFDSGERFEPAELVRIMGELLDALDFAHERSVIHRDVKPANVMLDAQRRVKLADFGVARIQDSDRSAAGTMVGTPAFMSPEQIKGGKVDGRTDIFSAGTILYQLLTGEQPFRGEGAWTVAKKIVEEDPPPPSSVVKSVSPAFDAIVDKALAKNPAQRFAKAQEFAAALRGALAEAPRPATTGGTAAAQRAQAKASETELEFWRSIQNRDDLDELELYVEQFPDGAYTRLARLKIAKLREPLEAARKAAEEKERQEAEARARREAEEQARREAAEKAKREADDKARRDAVEKARRETEEKARQAQALARLKQQQDAAAKAKAAPDVNATVADVAVRPAEPQPQATPKKSLAVPTIALLVVAAGAVGAYLVLGRKPAPVVEAPVVPKAEAPAPAAPPKVEISAAEVERIRKEAEDKVRREYADKSAAEQAAAAKAAAEKATQEKLAAMKAAAEKAAAEKAAAEKAAAERQIAAAKAASERAALEKAAAEREAAEKAAAEKAAAERAAAEKAAAERAAAEKAAAAKAAAAAKPGWPSVGDRWVYEVREVEADRRYQIAVNVQSASAAGIRDVSQVQGGGSVAWTHTATPQLAGVAIGIASFAPYLRALQDPQAGASWPNVNFESMWACSTDSSVSCKFDARVTGKERVTVRAGSYETSKIVVVFALTWEGRYLANGEIVYWYADEMKRTVKYQFRTLRSVSVRAWVVPDVDMELVSYVPAK